MGVGSGSLRIPLGPAQGCKEAAVSFLSLIRRVTAALGVVKCKERLDKCKGIKKRQISLLNGLFCITKITTVFEVHPLNVHTLKKKRGGEDTHPKAYTDG